MIIISNMDYTKDSQEILTQPSSKKSTQQDPQEYPEQLLHELPETIQLQGDKLPQQFYKRSCRSASGQNIVKHGYKAFSINRSEEDLCVFCMSLLQFQSMFPLRFFMMPKQADKVQNEQNTPYKDIWLQTQFLTPTETTTPQTQQSLKLQNHVYKFFTQYLIPKLSKFKQQKMSWAYMLTEQYTDQRVVHEFQDVVVRDLNQRFKEFCRDV